MIKVLLLVLSVAIVRNSYCLSLPGNFSIADVPKIIDELRENSGNEGLVVSPTCLQQLILLQENLKSSDDGMWALKMLDAAGKIPSGILTSNLADLGNFDECIAIEATKSDVKGKYCLASLPLTLLSTTSNNSQQYQNLFKLYNEAFITVDGDSDSDDDDDETIEAQSGLYPSIGICIPHKCTRNDFKSILKQLSLSVAANCQTKDDLNKPLDTGAIVTICYFGFFVSLMLIATIYDLRRNEHSTPHPLLIGFSIYNNGKRLLKTRRSAEELSCLDGIRFISMLWVILGHVYYAVQYGPVLNILDVLNFFTTTRSMIISNAVFSVDTFFVVTGFLVVYTFMKAMHNGVRFNLIAYYFHRFLRLTPAFLSAVLVSIYLLKYLGSGPLFPQIITLFSEPCRQNWWSTLFYFQNYMDLSNGMCLAQSWYLDIDIQLYLLSPIFLLFLLKRPMIGLSILLCAIIGVITSALMITWDNQLQSSIVVTNSNSKVYMKEYYLTTHTRAGPWLVGAVVGYIMGKIRFQLKLKYLPLSKWLVCFIWFIALFLLPVCLFGRRDELTNLEYNALASSFFNGFARSAWGVCIAWIIFACSMGYGGIINKFLSLEIFQVLNRFTYSMYLLHLTILAMIHMSLRQPIYFSSSKMVYSFGSVFVLSFGVSIFWVLAFESPIPAVEKYILSKVGLGSAKKSEMVNGTSNETILSTTSNGRPLV